MYAQFLHRLASFCRLIILDRRGTGLSDPVAQLPTLEERMDDIRAVMDAAGLERATLFGISEGGPMCELFAATYPERTDCLVLYGTYARNRWAPDYPWGRTEARNQYILKTMEGGWGQGVSAERFAPSLSHDEEFVRSWGQFERLALSPGRIRLLLQMISDCDVRHVLSTIRVPTLVLHRAEDRTPVEGARYLAEHIAGAKYVELPGRDHFPWVGDVDTLLGEVEEFLTGERHEPDVDRVLATVLFIHIVDANGQTATLDDRYQNLVRRELRRFRGQEINATHESCFATFDGPARGIRCACAIRDSAASLGLTIRAGLHTGECEMVDDQVSGMAVDIGEWVAGEAQPSEVLVSSTVKDLVAGSGLQFTDRGVHELVGIPDQWRLFVAES